MPPELVHFILVTVFGFLVGLEVKSYRKTYSKTKTVNYFFGDVRTFSFVAILGYILFLLSKNSLLPFLTGFASLTILYALLYYKNLQENKRSILLFIVMLIVYSFGAFIESYPLWMGALLYVSTVFILNADRSLSNFIERINVEEFETLGKMLLLSAVILPLLPNENVIPHLPLSPFKIWLAVVVISGISYGGYILQKYFFPSKGYFLTGILGGLYSSTATTVVLARKVKQTKNTRIINAAIIAATSVMYIRLLIIAFIFNIEVGKKLFLPFGTLALFGLGISYFLTFNNEKTHEHVKMSDNNPLELKTAFVFAFLFVIMMLLTQYVTQSYGSSGLKLLSFIVGFTDIDPFILSILTGKFEVTQLQIIAAVMIAAGSNNFLKAVYALWFGGIKQSRTAAIWIFFFGLTTLLFGLNVEKFL